MSTAPIVKGMSQNYDAVTSADQEPVTCRAIPELEDMLEAPSGELYNKLSLMAKCHPKSGVNVTYERGSGVLPISCHRCQRLVAEISVALVSKLRPE